MPPTLTAAPPPALRCRGVARAAALLSLLLRALCWVFCAVGVMRAVCGGNAREVTASAVGPLGGTC